MNTDADTDSKKILIMQTRVLALTNDVNELTRIVIKGDGDKQIPLVEKVRDHDKFIADVKYWMRFIGGAIVLQTISFLAGIIVAVGYFLPVLQRLAESSTP